MRRFIEAKDQTARAGKGSLPSLHRIDLESKQLAFSYYEIVNGK